MAGACAGIRVLDCSRDAAGSLATMILADFGADVVRIEAPGSNPVDAMPAYVLLQRGKRNSYLVILQDSKVGCSTPQVS